MHLPRLSLPEPFARSRSAPARPPPPARWLRSLVQRIAREQEVSLRIPDRSCPRLPTPAHPCQRSAIIRTGHTLLFERAGNRDPRRSAGALYHIVAAPLSLLRPRFPGGRARRDAASAA